VDFVKLRFQKQVLINSPRFQDFHFEIGKSGRKTKEQTEIGMVRPYFKQESMMYILFTRTLRICLLTSIFLLSLGFELPSSLNTPQTVLGGTDSAGNDWENLPSGRGPSDDPDLDGLDNLQEFFAGTDPNNSDSDGGGENDGSEVLLFGQDPLDPADDEIQSIPWVNAIPGAGKNTLQFGYYSEYDHLKLYRSLYPDVGYISTNDNIQPTGLFIDTKLIAGRTYYYRMVAIDSYGHLSRVSPTRAATPFATAMPWILLLLGN
jgi:hypothetical protein